jgi:hypothetical protein
MVPAGSSVVTWVVVGLPPGLRRKQGIFGSTLGTVVGHSLGPGASGSGIVFETTRPVTGSVGSRFTIVKVHVTGRPVRQVLVDTIPRGTRIFSVPTLPLLARVVVVRDVLLG